MMLLLLLLLLLPSQSRCDTSRHDIPLLQPSARAELKIGHLRRRRARAKLHHRDLSHSCIHLFRALTVGLLGPALFPYRLRVLAHNLIQRLSLGKIVV